MGGAIGAAYTKAVTGYDTAYRPLGTSITIPSQEGALAGTYTTTNSYSSVLGALTKTNIPAAGGLPAESVTYANSNTGLLFSTAGLGQTVVMQVDYDPLARPIRRTAGDYGTQVVSTQQYDWATGRVINSCIDRQVNTIAVDQTSYTYTPSGRITSVTNIQDASATDTQCFTYDHLSRLTGAWTDNPVNLSDPSGLRPEGVCGGFGTCSDDKGNVTTETFKLERDGSWTEAYWNVLVHNCNDARFSVGSDGVAEDLSNPLPPRGGYVGVPKLDGGTLPVVGNKIWGNSDPERLIGTRSPEDLHALASKRDAEKLQDFHAGAANAGKGGAAGRGPPYGCLLPP
ncbi:hypothetical protein AB0O91_23425 [Kitasatospora sp. NPDC089797]|uniref:hypothetical protein n=1 Tax=Kitasatospora sp. NPDC089797 TaxID=3155298 RepID=UPI00342AC6E9